MLSQGSVLFIRLNVFWLWFVRALRHASTLESYSLVCQCVTREMRRVLNPLTRGTVGGGQVWPGGGHVAARRTLRRQPVTRFLQKLRNTFYPLMKLNDTMFKITTNGYRHSLLFPSYIYNTALIVLRDFLFTFVTTSLAPKSHP